MPVPMITIEKLRTMKTVELQNAKKQLVAESKKIRARVSEIRDWLNEIKSLEHIPGFKTIDEHLAETSRKLEPVEKTKLGARLQKGVNKGEWDQGWKTVETNTLSRCARQPTYEPKVIRQVLSSLK